MLRSVLVAAFSAVVAFGALSGASVAKSDVRADTHWPTAAEDVVAVDTHWPSVVATTDGTDDTHWPVAPVDGSGN